MKLIYLAIKNRNLLINLILSDFKNRYLGNHLGIIWAFIQPLVMVAVYWFVFTKGFRASSISDAPFLLWLLGGIVPWFLISDAIISASSSITSQAFLVKKIVFEVKLLPLVKIGSSILANLAFWLLMIIVCFCYGYYPSIWWLQIFYYIICIVLFSIGCGLLFSAIMPFIMDIGQILNVFFQIMFWVTPVMWNQNMLHGSLVYFIKLNPFAYITSGVRDTFITHAPFWVHYKMMAYFWMFTIFIYYLGNKVFNNLRPHFADVL